MNSKINEDLEGIEPVVDKLFDIELISNVH